MTHLKHYAALLIFACSALEAQPAPDVASLFLKELADIPGKEVLMLAVEYPPGGADPVHRHDAHAFVYVLEGSIVMQVKGGTEVTLTPDLVSYVRATTTAPHGKNRSKQLGARGEHSRDGLGPLLCAQPRVVACRSEHAVSPINDSPQAREKRRSTCSSQSRPSRRQARQELLRPDRRHWSRTCDAAAKEMTCTSNRQDSSRRSR